MARTTKKRAGAAAARDSKGGAATAPSKSDHQDTMPLTKRREMLAEDALLAEIGLAFTHYVLACADKASGRSTGRGAAVKVEVPVKIKPLTCCSRNALTLKDILKQLAKMNGGFTTLEYPPGCIQY